MPVSPESSVTAGLPGPGDVLDRKYRVISVLGAGGMGVVLEVEHLELGQRAAVKLMLPEHAADPLSVSRFLREARAAARIQSEHVVRTFDVGTLESGAPYMVMELLRGEDLGQVLSRGGRVGREDAVEYVSQACHALAEAHAMGIVHRDLKPSNLFLCRRSDGLPLVKVLDFGISKAIQGDGKAIANLTQTKAIMGSPLYMSPEQVRDSKQVDARSDLWSLGVILHELMTGNPAFVADTLPGICAAIVADPPPLLRSSCPDAPAELEAVVTRCLEKRVEDRFQSTSELMSALKRFGGPRSSRSSSPAGSDRTMPEAGLVASPGTGSSPNALGSRPRGSAPKVVVPHPPWQDVKTAVSGPAASAPSEPPPAASATASALASSTSASATARGDGRRFSRTSTLAIVAVAALSGALLWWQHRTAPPAVNLAASAPAPSLPEREVKSFSLLLDSIPAGADVVEGGDVLGRTPMQISVDNESAKTAPRKIALRLAGYQPYLIVQGPSGESVRVAAPLVAIAPDHAGVREDSAPAPPAAPLPAHPAHSGAKAMGRDTSKPGSVAAPAAPAPGALASAAAVAPSPVAPPQPAPPDIRLQR